MSITVRRMTENDKEDWFLMRKALWPDAPDDILRGEQDGMLNNENEAVFLAHMDGNIAGMLEARLRDYAEGCETSPVGYIEGWFVYDYFRGKGVAGALVAAAEDWARAKGCSEMASDTWLDNHQSIRAHAKLGYEEVERAVHFAKKLK